MSARRGTAGRQRGFVAVETAMLMPVLLLMLLGLLDFTRRNLAAPDVPANAVMDADVVFLRDGTPDDDYPNQVEVSVQLSQERGNALELTFGKVIGIDRAEIAVTARAGVVGVTTSRCVRPFMVPTLFDWNDQAEPVGSSYRDNGQLDVDSALEMASIDVQGYSQENMGATVILKPGDPSLTLVPSHYNLVDLPPANKGTPVTGASMLAENIQGCTGSNSYAPVEAGDTMQLEPGNSVGPVVAAINDVVSSDPGAYWDTTANAVEGSVYADPMNSPRVAIVAFYDPRNPPVEGRTTLEVYQLGAVFIEGVVNKTDIQARFINALARSPEPGTDGESLLYMTRLLRDSSR